MELGLCGVLSSWMHALNPCEVQSLFPKQPESDLPQVLEHMQKLKAKQQAMMQKKGESDGVQLKKHKDVPRLGDL